MADRREAPLETFGLSSTAVHSTFCDADLCTNFREPVPGRDHSREESTGSAQLIDCDHTQMLAGIYDHEMCTLAATVLVLVQHWT